MNYADDLYSVSSFLLPDGGKVEIWCLFDSREKKTRIYGFRSLRPQKDPSLKKCLFFAIIGQIEIEEKTPDADGFVNPSENKKRKN